jgi:hypothetical protein
VEQASTMIARRRLAPNRVAGRIALSAPTPPDVRRNRRLTQATSAANRCPPRSYIDTEPHRHTLFPMDVDQTFPSGAPAEDHPVIEIAGQNIS